MIGSGCELRVGALNVVLVLDLEPGHGGRRRSPTTVWLRACLDLLLR